MTSIKSIIKMLNKSVLITGLFVSVFVTFLYYMDSKKVNVDKLTYMAESKMSNIQMVVDDYVSITDSLSLVVHASDGKIKEFNKLAKTVAPKLHAVNSVQLAPDGVVSYVYPEKGNEEAKINLFKDPERKEEAEYAKKNGVTTISGPFELKQGGYGLVVRNPIYLKDATGADKFWGFSIVVLVADELLEEADLHSLVGIGYEYELSVKAKDGTSAIMGSYGNVSDSCVAVSQEICDKVCTLKLSAKNSWEDFYHIIVTFIFLIIISLVLSAGCGYLKMYRRENGTLVKANVRLQEESLSDALTGVYNRRGGDECIQAIINSGEVTRGVLMALDIDDFKRLNDVYGHAAGDLGLIQLVEDMKEIFGQNAIYIRNGGDEFIIFIKNYSAKQIAPFIQKAVERKHVFFYNGEKIKFGISCGYMEYPSQGKEYSKMCKHADAALYYVKMNGKTGCAQYKKVMEKDNSRSQLDFTLTDIMSGIPSALLVYRADGNEDILFTNQGLIDIFECQNLDEFMKYTKGSFKTLVHPDDIDRVEKEIWEQIHNGNSNNLDYVEYRIITATGKIKYVKDYGRLVESKKHGSIFYVIVNETVKGEDYGE